MDVVDAGGFAGEAAFVAVFDVTVVAVEEVEDVEGDFPVVAAVAEAGVDDEAASRFEAATFFEKTDREEAATEGAKPAFVFSNGDSGGEAVLDGVGDSIDGEPVGGSPVE